MNIKSLIKSSPAFIIPSVINLTSLLVFTRKLSLETYGQLSLALISIEFFQGVVYQWITSSMMRFYKSDYKGSSVVIGLQYNILTSTLLLFTLFLVYILNSWLFKIDLTYVAIVTLGVIGRGLSYFVQDYTRISYDNLNKYTVVTLISSASFYLPAIIYLLLAKAPAVQDILLIQVTGVFVFLFFCFLKKCKAIFDNVSKISAKEVYREFLKYGFPLIIALLASSMFTRVDRYIIEHNVGLKQLGSYSAAFSLSNLAISSFFMLLTIPTYPEIIRKMNAGNEKAAMAIFKNNGNIILLVGIPVVFVTCFLNKMICNIFFADKGADVALVFPFVMVGTFLFNFKLHYFDQVFQIGKKTKVFMILGLLIGGSHLVLSYQLSVIWGAKGVALSGVLLNLLSIIFIYYYSKTFFEIAFNKKICLALLLSGILLSWYLFSPAL